MKGIKFCSASALNINKKKYKIFSRNSFILDYHVGRTVHVHVGNRFFILTVDSRMKGKRFGDFCLTRRQFSHKDKNKK